VQSPSSGGDTACNQFMSQLARVVCVVYATNPCWLDFSGNQMAAPYMDRAMGEYVHGRGYCQPQQSSRPRRPDGVGRDWSAQSSVLQQSRLISVRKFTAKQQYEHFYKTAFLQSIPAISYPCANAVYQQDRGFADFRSLQVFRSGAFNKYIVAVRLVFFLVINTPFA